MIATAIQEGSSVVVYDERFTTLFVLYGELVGYTLKAVTVKDGHSVSVYNDRGRQIFINFKSI